MAVKEPVDERNLDGYGAPPIPWARVRARLDEGIPQGPEAGGPDRHTCWLATVHPDGRPHVMPVGVLWDDGKLYFTAGPGTAPSGGRRTSAAAACAGRGALPRDREAGTKCRTAGPRR